MARDRWPLFGKTRFLERQIDEFLDKVNEQAILFERGMSALIETGTTPACEQKLKELREIKKRCNQLRRSVGNILYTEMLIPGFRGDVLSLLSDLYELVDTMADSYEAFLIEHAGSIAVEGVQRDLLDLVGVVTQSVRASVLTARAFFRDPQAVGDHVNEIRVYESEADAIALRLRRLIFASGLPLERKLHARDAVHTIDHVADMAEDISDEVSIYAIKRVL